jgi:hypothetical protein
MHRSSAAASVLQSEGASAHRPFPLTTLQYGIPAFDGIYSRFAQA